MATPRMAAKAGIPKSPPFGKSKSNVPKTGPQPPIPKAQPKSSKRFANKGKSGQEGFGGDKSRGY